jgi:hypothetical protein
MQNCELNQAEVTNLLGSEQNIVLVDFILWTYGLTLLTAENLESVYKVKITIVFGRFTISKLHNFMANPQVLPEIAIH